MVGRLFELFQAASLLRLPRRYRLVLSLACLGAWAFDVCTLPHPTLGQAFQASLSRVYSLLFDGSVFYLLTSSVMKRRGEAWLVTSEAGSFRLRGDRSWRLSRGELTVGRGPLCDVVLPVPFVSRSHCRLTAMSGGLYVSDLGSVNGTHVNGRRLGNGRKRLHSGDLVNLGRPDSDLMLRIERVEG